jgi:hypothetical protein
MIIVVPRQNFNLFELSGMVFPLVPFSTSLHFAVLKKSCGFSGDGDMEKCLRALLYAIRHMHPDSELWEMFLFCLLVVGAYLGRIPWDSRLVNHSSLLVTDQTISVTWCVEKGKYV